MAELNTSGGGRKKGPGVKKSVKKSTRVDLTPMVDLGFLLITFFIFTTTMSRPKAMKLIMPKDSDDPTHVKKSAVITLMLGKGGLVCYYEGDDPLKLQPSNLKDIRNIILDKKRRTDPKFFQVILKPSQDATYKETVDLLDEMTIDAIPHYAMVDITPDEYRLVQVTEKANGVM